MVMVHHPGPKGPPGGRAPDRWNLGPQRLCGASLAFFIFFKFNNHLLGTDALEMQKGMTLSHHSLGIRQNVADTRKRESGIHKLRLLCKKYFSFGQATANPVIALELISKQTPKAQDFSKVTEFSFFFLNKEPPF